MTCRTFALKACRRAADITAMAGPSVDAVRFPPPLGTRSSLARARDESGFTLVEAIVALLVLGIIFSALATASIGAIRASMNSRAEQQAIDFATQALERARQLEYYGLGHDATDAAADTAHVATCGTALCFNPGGGAEELVVVPGGSLNPHVQTVSSAVNNGTNFTVATYVTRPTGETADVKRVTVVTRWNVGTRQRERVTSSLLTATTRGLPIPLFKFETAANTQAVNPGTGVAPHPFVAFKVEMTNQGAPDRWDLSTDSGTWEFWRDNGDNILCMVAANCGPGVDLDTLLVDSDDPGTLVDTGRLDPTTSLTIWAIRSVPETTLGEYWANLTATAVSLNHGGVDAAAGTSTLALRTVVTNDVVTGQPGGGTPSTTVPTAPRNLVLTVGDGQLTAAWTAPENQGTSAITDYVVSYREAGDLTWITESDTSTVLSRVLAGLVNGTLYDVAVAARNAAGVGASSPVVQATPTAGALYVAPSICPVPYPNPQPVPARAGGYTLWNYALHNRSPQNPTWPGTGLPGPTSTEDQGVPLSMIKDNPQFPVGTNLPVYSEDVSPGEAGRVIEPGGTLTTGESNTDRFVDWRSDVPGRRYSGTAVLTVWVAPAAGTTAPAFSLTAQLYRATATDTDLDNANTQGLTSTGNSPSSPVTIGPAAWCAGYTWQQVAIALPIDTKRALAADEFLGVRLWNSGSQDVRIAYDVAGDFPAYLAAPEK